MIEQIKELSLEELAKRFGQKGNTCALASMMFSVAMLYRKTGYINENIAKDIESILKDENAYFVLRRKIMAENNKKEGIIEIEDVANYLSSNGYKVEIDTPTKDKVVQATDNKDYPVIVLNFNFSAWLKFFGSGSLDDWYAVHVISAIDIRGSNLGYFEPLAGERRKQSFWKIELYYGKEMAVIKPKKKR